MLLVYCLDMNPIRTTGLASFMFLLMSSTTAMHAFIKCDGEEFLHHMDIFSLDILLNNASAAHWALHKGQNDCKDRCASNVSGDISADRAYVHGSLDLTCGTDEVVCEIYGLDKTVSDYRKKWFSPTIEYDVGITEKIVKKQTLYPSKELLLTCAVTVGSNETEPRWITTATRGYSAIPTYQTILPNCLVQTTVYVIFDPKKERNATIFYCFLGDIEVGSISVDFNGEVDLRVHLFLTSLWVYLHFVIVPVICSDTLLGMIGLVKKYKHSENEHMRRLRGSISLIVAGVFFIWWIGVLSIHGWNYDCYLLFFLIETFFLGLYGTVRLVSSRIEEPGDRHLYNGRVALSCGAVIVPTVSWLMIKVQQGIPTCRAEGVWWLMTLFSLLLFVYVSQNREMNISEKKK